MQLSEHASYSPNDGSWLQRKVAKAVINSPKYSKTVLIASYDETGGWADHLYDPYEAGRTPTSPGFRVPFYMISPFTLNGGVYTEHCGHTWQLMFVEKWQAAMSRRMRLSHGVARTWLTLSTPLTLSTQTTAYRGFKNVRGPLAEGQILGFETSGQAKCLRAVGLSPATKSHDDIKLSKGCSFKAKDKGQYLAAGRRKQPGWRKNQAFCNAFSVTYWLLHCCGLDGPYGHTRQRLVVNRVAK
ncbi:hypothetical protein N0V84_001490 [Fusarium piperis]|uniref:Phospholipase C n=1 Tax=Fusarium piperis TaxID=1435070 RepID=A0A9W8WL41_9HYPO|nr:hypothetical protein N0V84_001490 [Fusarium piperis]